MGMINIKLFIYDNTPLATFITKSRQKERSLDRLFGEQSEPKGAVFRSTLWGAERTKRDFYIFSF